MTPKAMPSNSVPCSNLRLDLAIANLDLSGILSLHHLDALKNVGVHTRRSTHLDLCTADFLQVDAFPTFSLPIELPNSQFS